MASAGPAKPRGRLTNRERTGIQALKSVETKRYPRCGAVPWRLFEICSSPPRGLFANASHVERIFTHGGMAPSQRSTDTGDGYEVRVPFGAKYRFHRRGESPGETLAWADQALAKETSSLRLAP